MGLGYRPVAVCDIGDQVGANLIGNIAEALPVYDARIRGKAGHDQFGSVFEREAFGLVIIDMAGVRVKSVLHGLVDPPGNVHRGTVRQVTAVGEAHAHDRVTGFDECEVYGTVRLRSGMGLHVGPVSLEQFLGPIDGELLGDINILTTTVIALARVALGIFVR